MADPDLQIGEGGDGHPDPEIRGGGVSVNLVADPDLQIGEGGDGHPDPEIRGGGKCQFSGGSRPSDRGRGGRSSRP